MNDRLRMLQRQPRRITITLSYHVHEELLTRSEEEGRSVSNLCAFLLEDSLRHATTPPAAPAPAQSDVMGMATSNSAAKQAGGNRDLGGGAGMARPCEVINA